VLDAAGYGHDQLASAPPIAVLALPGCHTPSLTLFVDDDAKSTRRTHITPWSHCEEYGENAVGEGVEVRT